MIAMAKAQPGKLSYGTFAFPAQAFMDGLNKTEHTDIVRVPYKGGGEVVNAVLSGNTPIAVLALSNMVSLCKAGASPRSRWCPIRARRCFRTCRLCRRSAPARPCGRAGSACGPRPACRARSSKRSPPTADRIMADPAFQKRMYIDRGVEPATERLEAFAQFVERERKLAGQIVKESGQEPK